MKLSLYYSPNQIPLLSYHYYIYFVIPILQSLLHYFNLIHNLIHNLNSTSTLTRKTLKENDLQQVHNSLRRSVGRILVQMNCVVDSRPIFVIPKIPPTLIVPSSEEDSNTVLSKFQHKLVISCSCPNMI